MGKTFKFVYGEVVNDEKEGFFVSWEDYAALKAERDALVALTAQPVKKPQTHDAHGFPEPAHIINSRWIESIREAGHEVEGE